MADLVQLMLASIFIKRPARDFSAFARVSNQSEISSKPSSWAVFAIPGYMSVYSVSPATAAFRFSSVSPIGRIADCLEIVQMAMSAAGLGFGGFTEVAGDFGVAFYVGDLSEVKVARIRHGFACERILQILVGLASFKVRHVRPVDYFVKQNILYPTKTLRIGILTRLLIRDGK